MSDESKWTLEPVTPTSAGGSGGLLADPALAASAQRLVLTQTFLELLTRDLSFQEFSRELLLTILKVIHCEAGSLLEMHPNGDCLFFRASAGRSSDTVTNFTIPVGQGIAGHVAEAKTLMVVEDAARDAQHLRSIAAAVGFEARNLIAIPILVRGKVFSVLELINRVGTEKFSPADAELMQFVADAAAKCIEIRLMLGRRAGAAKAVA